MQVSQPNLTDSRIEGPVLAETTTETDPTLLLIERLKDGDAAALGALLEEQYDRIFRTAWRWCGNRADAEDIAQDVCVKLATAIPSFDGRSSFSTWVHRITVNAVNDLLRASSRKRRRDEGMANEAESSAPAHQEMAVANAQLWSAVRRLPERQRDAVLLVHAEDLSHAEAAAIMGIAEATVSVHLHAARKSLREAL